VLPRRWLALVFLASLLFCLRSLNCAISSLCALSKATCNFQ
jgi:hypothetical protein